MMTAKGTEASFPVSGLPLSPIRFHLVIDAVISSPPEILDERRGSDSFVA
jgi:hypothetical protein